MWSQISYIMLCQNLNAIVTQQPNITDKSNSPNFKRSQLDTTSSHNVLTKPSFSFKCLSYRVFCSCSWSVRALHSSLVTASVDSSCDTLASDDVTRADNSDCTRSVLLRAELISYRYKIFNENYFIKHV